MTYENINVNLSKSQIEKLAKAIKEDTSCTLRISTNKVGIHKLPLTKTQINKIKNGSDHDVELSKTQIKHIKSYPELKNGGFLPLAALIPLIGSVLAGVGGLTGGIASAVTGSKNAAEMVRHNKAIESANGLYLHPPGKGLNLFPPGRSIAENYEDMCKNGCTPCTIKKVLTKYHGKGVVANFLKNIPLIGSTLGGLAEKIGLGMKPKIYG
jgi:hypothetical protein